MAESRPRSHEVSEAAAADLARAGGRDATVEVVEHDSAWADRFTAERERLTPLLGDAEIHHIGSTAVPGLAAKPVIDLMALVDDVDAPVENLVQRGGYAFPVAFNATLHDRRWLCRPSAAHRTHHLHLVAQRAELERHLRFRDRLRADPGLAAQYAAVKRELAARFPDDRERYSEAKGAFVRRVVEASAVERGAGGATDLVEPRPERAQPADEHGLGKRT
jgi:GrpB-like predicted nucleotidyltransferase (UPF0157 family)